MSEKARVLLLNPPTAAVSTEVLLNLAYLAASLRKAGSEVKIIDATAPYNAVKAEGIKRAVNDFKPHFIGVTLTITYIPQTYAYLEGLRKMGIPIVAGGPHANCMPEEVLEHGSDIIVIGEGEETVVELVEHFKGNKPLRDIQGLCFKDAEGKPVYTARRNLIKNLDSIPFPDFSDFPIKNYTGSEDVDSNPIFWSLFTSRGCPFDCIFCSSHNVFGRTVRMRSAHNIFEEVMGLAGNFGVKRIAFQDDEILCSKKRFLEFCDLMIGSGLKIKMSMRTRIDSIDEEILSKAKRAGLTRISYGIESWNDDTLRKINKRYTVKTIHEKLKAIEKHRPFTSFNNICGFPWETREHLRKNLREIAKISKTIPYFTTFVTPIPYPKTRLYDLYHEKFGFTGWWLDEKKNSRRDEAGEKPFFMHFMNTMSAVYNDDIYWNYTKSRTKWIRWLGWRIFGLFARRHARLHEYLFIMLLCRISYFLWKISPATELKIFGCLPKPKIKELKNRFTFTTKS
ncbi:MAG: B12-binding domain-containing radical SAM protein [Candidatus Omnitrophica bacterium]|nr:B12-binding domain-containing radical SAM protein [Candidatus Omnitrophota bacterium]